MCFVVFWWRTVQPFVGPFRVNRFHLYCREIFLRQIFLFILKENESTSYEIPNYGWNCKTEGKGKRIPLKSVHQFCTFSFGHYVVCSSIYGFWLKEFEDTKGVIRIRISKKNRQHNGQKNKQRSTKHIYKTRDRVAICVLFFLFWLHSFIHFVKKKTVLFKTII
jgi:hypothetical protein